MHQTGNPVAQGMNRDSQVQQVQDTVKQRATKGTSRADKDKSASMPLNQCCRGLKSQAANPASVKGCCQAGSRTTHQTR